MNTYFFGKNHITVTAVQDTTFHPLGLTLPEVPRASFWVQHPFAVSMHNAYTKLFISHSKFM